MTLDITPRAAAVILAALAIYCADAWYILWLENDAPSTVTQWYNNLPRATEPRSIDPGFARPSPPLRSSDSVPIYIGPK